MLQLILTIRLPRALVTRLRAISAVTGLSMSEVVVAGFSRYRARLPRALRQDVERALEARRRHGVH